MTAQLPHMLRADAQENRDRVLDAARELFAEEGLGITMRSVARRAEVGPATLYRRFATKQELVEAVFADEVRACGGIVDDGLADPDPWRGFCSVLERALVLNSRNQGFTEAFTVANPDDSAITAHRTRLLGLLQGLAGRAVRAGALRPDFVIDDLVLVLQAGRGLSAVPQRRRAAAARRLATIALDGFRAREVVG